MALWRHQYDALEYAENQPNPAFFIDMGLGKTLIAMHYLFPRLLSNRGYGVVVAPLWVIDNWRREIEKHFPEYLDLCVFLNNGSILSKVATIRNEIERGHRKLAIINYETAWQGAMAKYLSARPPAIMILDESHRIKTASSKVSLFFKNMQSVVPQRVIMTGTPFHDKPLDVFGQMRYLDPSVFGLNWFKFRDRYAIMGGYLGKEIIGYRNLDELRAIMHKRCFILSVQEALARGIDIPLPDYTEDTYSIEPDRNWMKNYKQLKKEYILQLGESGESVLTINNSLTLMLRLQQLTSGFAISDDGEPFELVAYKDELLKGYLEDIKAEKSDERVVVFARFHHDLSNISKICDAMNMRYFEISGKVNMKEAWEEYGGQCVLGAQIQAAKEGIDLSIANHLLFYNHTFSLGDYQQSIKRVIRPNQSRMVSVRHLTVKGTVDEVITKAISAKENIVDSLMKSRILLEDL